MRRELSARTVALYESYLRRMRTWFESQPGKEHLVADGTIVGSSVTAIDVCDFLSATYDLQSISFTTFAGVTSAIKALLRAQKVEVTSQFQASIKAFLTGVKKDIADQRQAGTRRATVGKQPIGFDAYAEMARAFMQQSSGVNCKRFSFAHVYLVLTWNLTCRTDNTAKINLRHLAWHQDCLIITLPKSKTDQTGAKATHEKHVFANPLNPAVCPILALAIYWAILEPNATTDTAYPLVFPGRQQSARFGTHFRSILTKHSTPILRNLVTEPGSKGPHGIRKGATTHMSNASTAGPTHLTVCKRGQWTTGVMGKYSFTARAGDCYAGRILAGLDVNSVDFGVNCPEFPPDYDLSALLSATFPGFASYPSLAPILRRCLACLVYHQDFLRETLPANHLLFHSHLFQDVRRLEALKSDVKVDDVKRGALSTGLPPHTLILQGIREVKDTVASPGGVTSDVLSTKLHEILDPVVNKLLQQNTADAEAPTTETSATGHIKGTIFRWQDGSYRLLPDSFSLEGSLPFSRALRLWYVGTGTFEGRALPPFRVLNCRDFKKDYSKKNFLHLKWLIRFFEDKLQAPSSFTEEDLSGFFGRVVEWLQQKLVDVRQKQQQEDDEEAELDDEASRPRRKRIRKSCRVRDLGIRGLRKKLQVLEKLNVDLQE